MTYTILILIYVLSTMFIHYNGFPSEEPLIVRIFAWSPFNILITIEILIRKLLSFVKRLLNKFKDNKEEYHKKSISFLDLLVLVLSIYVIIIFAIEELMKVPTEISNLLTYIDDFICAIFLFDFFYRLFRAENKWKFMKWGWIDFISSIPAFPIMRIGRILRLFRLLRIFRSVKILISYVFQNRIKGALESAFIIAVLVVIVCSIGILIVEKDPNSNIKTAFDAIYWSMSSLITGYTGKFPVTEEGKLIQLALMFTGIGLIGTFTAYVASWFIEEDSKKNK